MLPDVMHSITLVSLAVAVAQGPLVGEWSRGDRRFTFVEDGVFEESDARTGEVIARLSYRLEDSDIIFRDLMPPKALPEEAKACGRNNEGRYRMEIAGELLAFRLRDDPCPLRAGALGSMTLRRVPS